MSEVLDVDDRGRVTIPKEWRENPKIKRVIAIKSREGILLIPVAQNPVEELSGAFKTSKSKQELKKAAEDLILKETEEKLHARNRN